MATLSGKTLDGPISFDLAPVKSNVLEQDAREYVLTIRMGRNISIPHRHFSVAGWQMQHDDVWVFARGFHESSSLMETKIPIDLWTTGNGRPADLFLSIPWLDAVIWGYEKSKQMRVVFFIKEDASTTLFKRLFILTNVKQTRDFGEELEGEIIQACPHWASERGLNSEKNC